MYKKQYALFFTICLIVSLYASDQKNPPSTESKKIPNATPVASPKPSTPASTPPQNIPKGRGSGILRLSASQEPEEPVMTGEEYFKQFHGIK